ncbi:hypothetical protein QQP08_016427 [Theobroma cacao]|nr:hypothetical protein QQP08_016427 [Theobroma cacao]
MRRCVLSKMEKQGTCITNSCVQFTEANALISSFQLASQQAAKIDRKRARCSSGPKLQEYNLKEGRGDVSSSQQATSQ